MECFPAWQLLYKVKLLCHSRLDITNALYDIETVLAMHILLGPVTPWKQALSLFPHHIDQGICLSY